MTESINKGDIFHHNDNDMKYEILHHANVNCKNKDFVPQIVYRSIDTGRVYSRPESEFQEKFYKFSASAMLIEQIYNAAQAVINQWDSMNESDKEKMGDSITELRYELQQLKESK